MDKRSIIEDPAIDEYLTQDELERVEVIRREGSNQKAAAALGIGRRVVDKFVTRIVAKVSKAGYAPGHQHHGKNLPGFLTKFVTTNRDKHGNIINEFHRQEADKTQRFEAFENAVDSVCEKMRPFKRVPAPKRTRSDLLTNYVITDFHLGMYAWHLETGADWDMKIAESVMLNAVSDMMDASPDSQVAIFSNIGDLLHWDGLLAVTPANKNVLDADTRFDLLVEAAINICEKAVEMLLHKHKEVHVIHAEGNHDPASSIWLRRLTRRTFRDNPRVTVETSPRPYYHYLWGKVFLGWHHGHLQKMENLPLVFSTDLKFREDFGKSAFAYIKTGHRHTKEVIEKGGIIVEQVETLAARDAHAARNFDTSMRGTIAVTYDKNAGEVSRCTVRPRTDKAVAAQAAA